MQKNTPESLKNIRHTFRGIDYRGRKTHEVRHERRRTKMCLRSGIWEHDHE